MTSKREKPGGGDDQQQVPPPSSELLFYPWFHGVLTRSQVDLVMHPRKEGLFLVRESTSSPGTYVLCVCHSDEIVKFVIEQRKRDRRNSGYVISHGTQKVYPKEFASIVDIIEHFKKERNGMPTRLTTPLKRRVLGFGVWEYQHDDGHWYPYPSRENRLIEQALHDNESRLHLLIDGHPYAILIDSRLQRSDELGIERKIRRRQVTATESEIKASLQSNERRLKLRRSKSAGGSALSPTTLARQLTATTLNDFKSRARTRSFHHSKSSPPPPLPYRNPALVRESRTCPGSPVVAVAGGGGVIQNRKPVLPRPRLLSKEEINDAASFDADDEEDDSDGSENGGGGGDGNMLMHEPPPMIVTTPEAATKRHQKAPIYWTSPDKSGTRPLLKLVPLLTSSMEYNRILNAMLKSMPVTVQRIARIENVELWEAYCRKRDLMNRKRSEAGVPDKVKECSLFHGTKIEYTSSICRQNFDFRLSGQHGANYGHGNYFAVTAAKAAMYSPPDQEGNRYMFVCKVLVGDYVEGRAGLRRPPPKHSVNRSFDLYDSVCDNVHDPNLFVVFDNEQAYPDYMITFR
ncbi:uncharacterized protein [Oscarella lobularis]|uniref:uncharacterized protein n=1 Tax=Oscarella lobularis TaxID=121494 RepID=UPI00331384FA